MSAYFTEDIDYHDFLKTQNPKNKPPESALSASIRTYSSTYASSPSFYAPPAIDIPSPSSSIDILHQPSKEEQVKTAVHLSLSNGSKDSTWIYDNELFRDLSAKWDSSNNDNLLHKAIALLDNYLGIDGDSFFSLPSFFYTVRTHYKPVEELKTHCRNGTIKTILDLLEKLIAIERDPEGLLQTTIAVMASKVFPGLEPPKKPVDIEEMFLNLSPFNM